LLRPLPYRDPGRLVYLRASDPGDASAGTSYETYEHWKSGNRSFEDIAVYYRNSGISRVTLTGIDEPESVQAGFVSANLFDVLGVYPALGRPFTPQEEIRRERVAILSDALWKRRFSASRDVIGRTFRVNDAVFTIIGVMPAQFQF